MKHGLELERHVSTLDAFRMDKQGLEQYILELLSNETVNKLKQFEEPDIISQIVQTTLQTISILPNRYSKSVLQQLTLLAAKNRR